MNDYRPLPAGGYRDLIVWQRPIELIDSVYKASSTWPQFEIYGLTSQIRRAAVSVAANTSEGNGRNGRKEYIHRLGFSRGSLHEVGTMLVVAERQQHVSEED